MNTKSSFQWTDERIEQVRKWLAEGIKRKVIQEHYGVTKSVLAGAIYRYLTNPEYETTRERNRKNKMRSCWDESNLTEKWEDRKARRAAEKKAAQG